MPRGLAKKAARNVVKRLRYSDEAAERIWDLGPEAIESTPRGWTRQETLDIAAEVTSGDFSSVSKRFGKLSTGEVARSVRQLHRISSDAYGYPMHRKSGRQWQAMAEWLRDNRVLSFETADEPGFEIASKYYKMLGVGAAAGAGALYPKESEAMPAGVYKKALKVGKDIWRSSAAERLAGYEVKPGKVISDVIKSRGVWRKIKFTDGTEMTVKKEYINDLARQVGRKRYVEKFQQKDTESKTVQALKSMKYHEARQPTFGTRDMARRQHRDHLKRLKEYGGNVLQDANTVFVQRGTSYFQMPTEYAEHLEKLGILKIVKGTREKRIFERFGAKPKVKK